MSDSKVKVLVTGATGQLGRALVRTTPGWIEMTASSRQQLDITSPDVAGRIVADVKPDWIVNAAAYTAVDRAESEQQQAYLINEDGAANLARTAAGHGVRMIQISTDYVFSGAALRPWLPDDEPAPVNVYGASKLAGEKQVIEELGSNALVLRTSWLYSLEGPSFLATMLRLLRDRTELNVVEDQIGTPTSANSLAQVVFAAIRNNVRGIHHWSDAGVASWFDFTCAIRDLALVSGLLADPAPVQPISTKDYPTPAKRPLFSVLDKTASRAALGISGEHWRESLAREMQVAADE